MSYGQDWYRQTRNPTQGRTVREELGELALLPELFQHPGAHLSSLSETSMGGHDMLKWAAE